MKRAIRIHLYDFLAIIGLALIATLVGVYILDHERLRFPLFDDKPVTLKAEFTTAQAVIPGQGQTVRVSGVRVGDIAKTELVDGHAVITMELDRKFEKLVHEDAEATLRPKTGLKDMFVELDPGTARAPRAKEGYVIPIAATEPDVNPDEVLASLDADTRDHLKVLLQGAGRGLDGRGKDLSTVYKRFEPTYRDLALVSGTVKQRSHELRRLIHSLEQLNRALAGRDDDLARLVQSANGTFRALASERGNVRDTVHELPGALREARDALAQVEQFALVLRPAAGELIPVAKSLQEANRAITPFAREAAPQLKRDIRPFVREARPLMRELRPTAHNLVKAEPDLTRTFKVLNNVFNMLAYNPNGREASGKPGREEGFLFWLSWLGHTSTTLFNTADAHGPARAITLGGTCNTIKAVANQGGPQVEFILGLTGLLTDPRICGGS
jgi:phospholipid/cholesterol/gamma-HCH transport system substrate-binding protein